jgi:S-(hydroxymethyl)glutathione dehydrogenase/alcohol dehydrogenase
MRAALLRRVGDPALEIVDDMETVPVGAGQVRVRVRATGLCHSDLSAMTGVLRSPAPFVPGHEGAGEVTETGPGVTGLAEGDHVVFHFIPSCGACADCRAGDGHLCTTLARRVLARTGFRLGGRPVFAFSGCGTFAEETVVGAESLLPVPDDLPFDLAALLGCGVTTGTGAVFHTARVRPGSTVAVIGCGGVGAAAVMAAHLAGAAQVLAVEPRTGKHGLLLELGATAVCRPDEAAAVVSDLTRGRGVDYCFEAVGRAATARAAVDLTRRGGTTVVIGAGGNEEVLQLSMRELFADSKRLLGSLSGGTDPRRQVDTLVELWRAGRLDLGRLITDRLPLHDINKGFDLMRSGEGIRTVVEV